MRFFEKLLLCFLCSGLLAHGSDRPNVVLILVDDLGWKDVGYKSKDGFLETPCLDSLRKESMEFTQAYAGGANCVPSRACLLSGLYGPRHGVYAVGSTDRGPKAKFRLTPVPNTKNLRSDIFTVAEAMKAAGYRTGHFGKWHIGDEASGTGPKDQGFEVSPKNLIAPEREKQPGEDPKKMNSITAAAKNFISTSAAKGDPFFALVAHHAVHVPIQHTHASLAKLTKKAEMLSPNERKRAAAYGASVFDMDASIGELLAHLRAQNLENDTVVIFTSDNGGPHGMTNNEPLRGAKGGYYEGGIRVPMLVRWPKKVQPGSQCDKPVIQLDFYPTLIELAKWKSTSDAPLDGGSLVPFLMGKTDVQHPPLFWHFPGYLDDAVPRGRDPVFRTRPVTTMRDGDWKIHLYHEEWLLDGGQEKLDTNNAVEIYNLSSDPGERTDLAKTEVAKRTELLAKLLAWMDKTKAPMAAK